MAPAPDTLSPAGSSTYNSDTLNVGDGTWDFTKNTYLLPPLMGVNFETMRYNGMGNRFSTIPQYHRIVLAHGIIAAITFLFLVPFAVMLVRFQRAPTTPRRNHAYINIFSAGLATVVFVLGWFAVGPKRSLTNPHHGIGVAIYTLVLVQVLAATCIRKKHSPSLTLMLHRWFGRVIALLGIVQVPLGLTLYGSPKYLFILYALWMSFLLVVYFICSWRNEKHIGPYAHGARSEGVQSEVSKSSDGGGMMKWLGPLALGAGIFGLMKGRGREHSPSPSHSRVRSRSRSRGPEVLSSRRGSESYFTDEKYSDRTERTEKKTGFFTKLLAAGAGAALLSKFIGRRKERHDDEYSSVESDTPTKSSRHPRHGLSEVSEVTTDYTESDHPAGRRTPLLSSPATAAAAAAAAVSSRPARPTTPKLSHRPGPSAISGYDESDYSSYISASPSKQKRDSGVGKKGLLASLGLGWIAGKMMKGREERKEEERMRYEDERRAGTHDSRYTGDGYSSPSKSSYRRTSRRHSHRPVATTTITSTDVTSDLSSTVEPRPATSGISGPPMPPLTAHPGPDPPAAHASGPTITPVPIPPAGAIHHSRSRSHSRHDSGPVDMPSMPPDPQGILHRDSESEEYISSGGHGHRRSSQRRREGEAAAAAAAASASRLAAEEEDERRRYAGSAAPSAPVSVSVKMHSDRDRNVTLRRLTDEEAAMSRREHRRRQRADSVSSISASSAGDNGGSSHRRYRRESRERGRRPETASEQSELAPPNPPFAGGKKKDSAYYSGQPGPSGTNPGATVSSLGSPDSRWSALSPSPSGAGTAADRRKRRQMERRKVPPGNTVEFS